MLSCSERLPSSTGVAYSPTKCDCVPCVPCWSPIIFAPLFITPRGARCRALLVFPLWKQWSRTFPGGCPRQGYPQTSGFSFFGETSFGPDVVVFENLSDGTGSHAFLPVVWRCGTARYGHLGSRHEFCVHSQQGGYVSSATERKNGRRLSRSLACHLPHADCVSMLLYVI